MHLTRVSIFHFSIKFEFVMQFYERNIMHIICIQFTKIMKPRSNNGKNQAKRKNIFYEIIFFENEILFSYIKCEFTVASHMVQSKNIFPHNERATRLRMRIQRQTGKNWYITLCIEFTYFFNSGMEMATPARNNGYKNQEGFWKNAKWCMIVASLSRNG